MTSTNSLETRMRVKIGLLFMVVILYVVGVFVYSYNLKKNIDEQKKEIADSYEVLSQSNQLIASVQQAQDILNAYLISPKRTLQKQYDSISSDISKQIIDIKSIASEKEQDIFLEDIDSLLQEKNKIVNALIVQFRSKSPLKEFDKKIQTYNDFIKDSVLVTTNKDTTIVVKEKKKFWDRVKNLISPSHAPDTVISVAQTQQETRLTSRVDTVMYSDLKKMSQTATRTYSTQLSGIEKQVRELILAEQNISLQISQLLTEFYNETIRITRQGVQNSELLIHRIFTFAIVIGALSLAIILVIIFFLADDINKGQKARLDLAKEKQLTESLMESRHKLLLSVSHDIKTPLNSIMGYMEMWNMEDNSENKKRQLQSAQNSGQHILSMLTNLLQFSRLERNFAELNYSRFELTELMDEIIGMFQPLAEAKKLTIEPENLIDAPFFIETDYTVLKQILINVISNAVKYTAEGGVHVKTEYRNNLFFTVTDTGIGMVPDDLQKIFKPFSRLNNELKAEGTGFGMYVTNGLVQSLKGTINIQSEKGKGTSVIIQLPVQRVENTTTETSETLIRSEEKSYNKILLFEDDAALGNLITEFLVQNGFRVKLCSNARDVKGFINHIAIFDIVFTDMQMVHTTGTDILHEIRRSNTEIPVWLMTAYDDYTTEKAVSEGFNGFLKKPVQMNRFIEILRGRKIEDQKDDLLNKKFPSLVAMFGDDKETIVEILSTFVQTANKDTANLAELIETSDFKEAQRKCHKMHPFLNQIGASHLCDVLMKMDTLRGQEETAYPNWKEELANSARKIREYADAIQKEFLS